MGKETGWRLSWSDELSVGIPEIDKQHRQFIGLINDLNEAILARSDPGIIQGAVDRLIQDARDHFAYEEELFVQCGYADMEAHTSAHAALLGTIEQARRSLTARTPEPAWMAEGLKVRDALVEHLLEEDMKYRGKIAS